GATSVSRVNPIVCIARAAAPMLPGWLVRTSTIRTRVKRSTAGGFDVGDSPIRTLEGHRHRERDRCTVEYRSIALFATPSIYHDGGPGKFIPCIRCSRLR